MATRDCEDEVHRAGGDFFTREDARAALEAVDALAEKLIRDKGLSPEMAAIEAARQLGNKQAFAAAVERRQRLISLQKRIRRRNVIQAAAEALKPASGKRAEQKDFATAIRNLIHAINTPIAGGRASAEAVFKARLAEYAGGIEVALRRAGLLKTVRDRTIEKEWARELWELSRQAAGRIGAKPGVTGNAEALKIARTIHGFQQLAKQRLNAEGAYVGDYSGYITRTVHDPLKIYKAGSKNWIAFVKPLLDPEKMGDIDTLNLGQTYHSFITGTHLKDDKVPGIEDEPDYVPTGANVANKASASRVLHFRDAESWYAYQQRFGQGNLIDQVFGSFRRASRQEALLRTWGPNPRNAFDSDFEYLEERHFQTDPDAVIALKEARKELTAKFEMLDGTANIPANRRFAEWSNNARTIVGMAKLGLVAATHLGSIVSKSAELRYQGIPFLDRWGSALTDIFKGRGAGQMRDLSDALLAGLDGMHGTLLSHFSPDDGLPGRASKIANTYFKWTGLTYLVDAQKSGAARVMSRFLGSMVDREFSALPAETRRAFAQYGIGDGEWNALRGADDHFMSDGKTFLTPHAAMTASEEAMRGLVGDLLPTEENVAAARDALALKLHTYIEDVANRSIITPGIGERYLTTQGLPPGSLWGEGLRFVSQFKNWPIAAVRQGLGREVYGGQGAGAIAGIVQLTLSGAAIGYLTMSIKDAIQGKNPRPPSSPMTWIAAMTQGGGFGLIGDFLFGQYGRFGQSVSDTALGPVLGQGAAEIMNLWNDLKGFGFGNDREARQARRDIAPELLRFGVSNLPFVNLHFARAALNYLLLYSAQESLNPGYLARHEQKLKQDTGQTFFLRPAQNHLHTFGR